MREQQKGNIVILNGPSGSGKTSIQRAFQEISKTPYLSIGIDQFFVGVIPPHYFVSQMGLIGQAIEGLPKGSPPLNIPVGPNIMTGVASHDEKGPLYALQIGEEGQRIIKGMHRAIAAYAHEGCNIIVDYIQYDKAWWPDLMKALSGLRVVSVRIDLPFKVLEEREAKRHTSPKGHARSHFDSVHEGIEYDLRLDTSESSPKECAEQIQGVLKATK